MKKYRFSYVVFILLIAGFFCLSSTAKAQDAKADNKAKETKSKPKLVLPSSLAPKAFWAKPLPKVSGKVEQRYDINRDGILQTSETKIFLRHVQAEILANNFYSISDSALLKAYDKNKDGAISRLELEEIKKDLSY